MAEGGGVPFPRAARRTVGDALAGPGSETAGYRPLYRQVYDIVVRRLAEGAWRPGEALPSEQALAAQLGVSQGTVRKVLDALTAEKLLERRQGKGTYVAEHDEARALFRFFRLSRPGGARLSPAGAWESVRVRRSTPAEQARLALEPPARVVEITRVRNVEERPAVFETIVTPADLVPGIEAVTPLPNTLYSLYQSRYGLSIVQAHEELSAVAADAEAARRLGVPQGAPLLQIDRLATSLGGVKVEWRLSRVTTRNLVYAVDLV